MANKPMSRAEFIDMARGMASRALNALIDTAEHGGRGSEARVSAATRILEAGMLLGDSAKGYEEPATVPIADGKLRLVEAPSVEMTPQQIDALLSARRKASPGGR